MRDLGTIRHARPILLAIVVLMTGLLVTPAPAAADEDAGRMVLVLDSSGSMKERTSSGETKIAAARTALRRVIGSLPDQQSVGLRVYGAEVFSRTDPGACRDSQLVVPVDTGNRSDLTRALDRYRPYGETPIGYALQEAGKDLGGEGRRTIVLVSDGEPTCDPDPCEVAKDLAAQGVDLKIDVVGLDVDAAAREKLRCIAGAGGGTYYDVDSSDELAVSLEKLSTRAARPYTVSGEVVRGTPTPEGAPTISDGAWLDTLGTSESDLVKHYVVERRIPGSTLHVTGTLRTATGDAENLDVTLETPDGEDCGVETGFSQLSRGALVTAGVSAGIYDVFGGVDEDAPCAEADTLLATIDDEVSTVEGPRPLELRVLEEPPVSSTDGLPEPGDAAPAWSAPAASGGAAPVTGGSSLIDAPLLEPGAYRDTIVPGEVLTYAVDVGWGQSASAEVVYPEAGQKLETAVGRGNLMTKLAVLGPARLEASTTLVDGAPLNQGFLDPGGMTIGAATPPVHYLNRTGGEAYEDAALAGLHTVTLFLEEDPDGESYAVPFTLRLGVAGQVTDGPAYDEVDATGQADATESSSAEPTPSPSPDQAVPAEQEDSAVSGWLLGLGALLLVVLLLGAGFVLRRGRGAPARGTPTSSGSAGRRP